MMNYDKLIDDLRWWADHCDDRTQHGCQTGRILSAAATALSTLQAENEKLQADIIRFNDLLASYQNVLVPELRAELEQVKRERNTAVKQLHGICSVCKNYSHYHNRGKCRFCMYEPARDKDAEVNDNNDNWEWRGKQKED